jgi:hypothetical protein
MGERDKDNISFIWWRANKVGAKFGGGKASAERGEKGVWWKGISTPAERKLSKFSVRIFLEKSSGFIQGRQHFFTSLGTLPLASVDEFLNTAVLMKN